MGVSIRRGWRCGGKGSTGRWRLRIVFFAWRYYCRSLPAFKCDSHTSDLAWSVTVGIRGGSVAFASFVFLSSSAVFLFAGFLLFSCSAFFLVCVLVSFFSWGFFWVSPGCPFSCSAFFFRRVTIGRRGGVGGGDGRDGGPQWRKGVRRLFFLGRILWRERARRKGTRRVATADGCVVPAKRAGRKITRRGAGGGRGPAEPAAGPAEPARPTITPKRARRKTTRRVAAASQRGRGGSGAAFRPKTLPSFSECRPPLPPADRPCTHGTRSVGGRGGRAF